MPTLKDLLNSDQLKTLGIIDKIPEVKEFQKNKVANKKLSRKKRIKKWKGRFCVSNSNNRISVFWASAKVYGIKGGGVSCPFRN